ASRRRFPFPAPRLCRPPLSEFQKKCEKTRTDGRPLYSFADHSPAIFPVFSLLCFLCFLLFDFQVPLPSSPSFPYSVSSVFSCLIFRFLCHLPRLFLVR